MNRKKDNVFDINYIVNNYAYNIGCNDVSYNTM